jgi:NADH-quinone oxidoreductase subunit L
MQNILIFLILLPLIGLLVSFLINKNEEKSIFGLTLGTLGVHFVALVFLIGTWLGCGPNMISHKVWEVYHSGHFHFDMVLQFDEISAIFGVVADVILLLCAVFSRYYIHRDAGFKRYFSTMLLFALGLNLIIFSGNFETVFTGWEIIGIASFILIAYYRDRYLPVKNASKVISVYRLGDIALLLGIWLSYHLWHEHVTFAQLSDANFVGAKMTEHPMMSATIALLFIIAAAVKSAQLPFSSWLPRAMEGPTSSSAIFYGALSVHMGVFLLLRTYPFWSEMMLVKGVVITLGLCTALVAASIVRVQPTAKTQIAYGSIAQIGLMFIEVALGWHVLALVHFMGNAFLRVYQLLVSPSLLHYFIHDQFYNYTPSTKQKGWVAAQKMQNTLYILGVKEWNLDTFQVQYLWSPFKWLGNKLRFFTTFPGIFLPVAVLCLGLYDLFLQPTLSETMQNGLSLMLAFSAMILVLNALSERGDARRAWWSICVSQWFVALAIAVDTMHDWVHAGFFLVGSIFFGILGHFSLSKIAKTESSIALNSYLGHVYEHPKTSFAFLLAALGLAGFPFSPTFLGIDLMLSYLTPQDILLVVVMAIYFIFMELAALRIYARVFLGQHVKQYHEIAYRSS